MLIADSGSTKTDWILIDNRAKKLEFKTTGLNPLFISENVISDLKSVFDSVLSRTQINQINFFGSGCGTDSRKNIVKSHLLQLFPNSSITVESDLVGAAIALFGDKPGLPCILGTGCNSGVFDGRKITEQQISLGYVLGDEGSATHISKLFFQSLFYGKFLPEIEDSYYKLSGLLKDDIIENIYRQPYPNRFLAMQLNHILPLKEHPDVKNLINYSLNQFFDTHLKYNQLTELELGFVGSLAWHLKDELSVIAKSKGYNLNKIVRYPINDISSFYIKHMANSEVVKN